MELKKSPKVAKKLVCEKCDYMCRKASDFTKHTITYKHLNGTNLELAGTKKIADNIKCIKCNKTYKTASGLWKHSKNCTKHAPEDDIVKPTTETTEDVKQLTTMVIELMKSNGELQKQMLEVCKNSNNTIITNSHNNNNNKTFNLQFFLNEQCKDAMNISEFVNTFDLQLEDLESVGELGYVEGMTKIIVDKLNSMDIYKRPMHCSDAKREIIYVKDENVWAKEERTNPKLRQAIKTVTFRNMKQVKKWSDTYPESLNNESRLNDKYMMLVIQSTGGNGLIMDSENKIIRRITKEIIIGKGLI